MGTVLQRRCNCLLPSYVFFQVENVPKPLSAGPLPRTMLGELTMLPQIFLVGWEEGHPSPLTALVSGEEPGQRMAPEGVKMSLVVVVVVDDDDEVLVW